MKLGPVTKIHKTNKKSKKFDDDVMSENCDVIVIFPISSGIQLPDCSKLAINFEQSGSGIPDA